MWTSTVTPSTPSTMTRRITTRAICTSEHSSAPLVVFHVSLMMCHTTLAQVHWVFHLTSSACRTCVVLSDLFDLPFYFDLSFPVFFLSSVLMHPDLHIDLNNLDSVENKLRHSAKGSNDGYDVSHSLTGYEPKLMVFNELIDSLGPFACVNPSSDQDIDDTTFGKLVTEAHREYADYRNPEGVFVSPSSLFVASDRTGKPVGKSNIDPFSFGVRNAYSAHNQFPAITQAEKVVDRTGKPAGESSSNAQIRTLLDDQRLMIIAEYCEKIGQHELQAAHAEEERRILQEEFWRQQKDFREAHQQSYTDMEELRKFQSSTFDTFARRKLIEDQNTILEFSGRLQELQNEVIVWTILRTSRTLNQYAVEIPTLPIKRCCSQNILLLKDCWDFHSYRRAAKKGRQVFGTHMVFRETFFCKSTCIFIISFSSRIQSMEFVNRGAAPYVYSGENWKERRKSRSEMPVWTVSQRFSHLQWRRLFKESWGRPTTTADFGSPFWEVPYASNLCLLEDKVQDRGMYLFKISYGGDAMDQGSGVGWFSGWIEIFVIYSWYLNAEFLKYLMWGLFQHWPKSSTFLISKEDSVWRNKRPRKRTVSFEVDRMPAWSSITSGSLGAMILSKTIPTCSLFFRNDDIQEFDSKWDGILLSSTKIPHDDILEGLYKLRVRESEKLKTVLELYDLETHQKKLGPDYPSTEYLCRINSGKKKL